jgi:hypothetical protein
MTYADCNKCKDTGRGYRAFYGKSQMICDCSVGQMERAWLMCSDEQHEASRQRNVEVTMGARKAARHARRDARRAAEA